MFASTIVLYIILIQKDWGKRPCEVLATCIKLQFEVTDPYRVSKVKSAILAKTLK